MKDYMEYYYPEGEKESNEDGSILKDFFGDEENGSSSGGYPYDTNPYDTNPYDGQSPSPSPGPGDLVQ